MQKKVQEKQEAISMRREGLSIVKIAKELGVSKSSISIWVREVKISVFQDELLKENSKKHHLLGAYRNKEIWANRRSIFRKQGSEMAKKGDLLHSQGCMLFWGEGDKKRNGLTFTNSDPKMMVFFCKIS